MERLGIHKLGICKLVNADLCSTGVQALGDFVDRVMLRSDALEIGEVEVDFSPVEAVQKAQEQAVIGSKKKQGRVVFVGVTALIEAENGICLLKSAEVVIVFPERLVVKCQNQSDTPQQGGATGKGLIYSVVIADNPGLDSLVQPRAFDGTAATVMELRAIPAVHIFRCVLVISNMHVGLLFWA